MDTPGNIQKIPYDELVFVTVKELDVWRGPWHKEGSWGVLATFSCGHKRALPRTRIPRHHAHCVQCTLIRRKRVRHIHKKAEVA